MILRKSFYSAIIVLLFCNCIMSQQSEFSDCMKAYKFCELGDYYFPSTQGSGHFDKLFVTDNPITETNSIWTKLEIKETGTLELNIVPDRNQDDIDFILYRSPPGSCDELEPIRVMTSGPIIGREHENLCVGQTGLRRLSTDNIETPGCYDFHDNYLRPVRLENGYTYYLFINNFNSTQGLTVLLDSEDGLALEGVCDDLEPGEFDIQLFPNPSTSHITIISEGSIMSPMRMELIDELGRIILIQDGVDNSLHDIKTDGLTDGLYYLRVIRSDQIFIKSFMKKS